MVNEKVVIVLLLITIILSIFSVIMALGTPNDQTRVEKTTINNEGPSNGQVAFAIIPESQRGPR